MNEYYTCNDGLRLITQFEGSPRTTARLCEGDRWELSFGVTFYPDGSPVKQGDTCSEDQALAMFRHALEVFEAAVRDMVTVPLTQHQFSALVAFTYNVGEANARKSTVLRETNNNRIYDAAAAFGMWLYATKNGRKQAYRGLLRRRYAEACLYLGYDWIEACDDEFIRLKAQPPAGGIGTDAVLFKTPWADVLQVARDYPLAPPIRAPILVPEPFQIDKFEADVAAATAPPSITIITDTPAAPAQAGAKAGTPEPATQPKAPASPAQNPAASTSSGPSRDVADKGVAPSAPVVPPPTIHPGNAPVPKVTFPKDEPKVAPAPAPAPPVIAGQDGAKPKSPNTTLPADVPYKIDPNAGLKPLEESDRAKGYVVQQVGISIIRLGSLGVFGTTIQAGAQTVQGDPVLSNIILMAFIAAGVAVVGYVVKVYGDWKRKRGEANASQGMY